jgi:hypothetical protein
MDSWSCLLVGKDLGMVPEDLSRILKAAGCMMHLDELDRMPIMHETCTGVVETTWQSFLVGARSGVLFKSAVDYRDISTEVNFLLAEKDLKAGAELLRRGKELAGSKWVDYSGYINEPEMYKFGNLRPYRLN